MKGKYTDKRLLEIAGIKKEAWSGKLFLGAVKADDGAEWFVYQKDDRWLIVRQKDKLVLSTYGMPSEANALFKKIGTKASKYDFEKQKDTIQKLVSLK